jgi:acyl carrier protein
MRNNFTRLQNIIRQQLGVDLLTIKLESNFEKDLGADSLDVLEIIIPIEYEFGIEDLIDYEIYTVQETLDLDYIESLFQENDINLFTKLQIFNSEMDSTFYKIRI